MRTDPMGKFCHPEKRSVVGQCEGVCRSIAFVRDDALYGKSKTPSEETLTGFWCPGQESNLHASRHTHLKRASRGVQVRLLSWAPEPRQSFL